MSEMTVIRTARKAHRCDSNTYACRGMIQPGERYAYSALPPNGEFGNDHWWHGRTCATCAALYGRPFDADGAP